MKFIWKDFFYSNVWQIMLVLIYITCGITNTIINKFLGSRECGYSFIAITPRFTLKQSGSLICGPYWTVGKLFVFDSNTWYHITMCKKLEKLYKKCKYKHTMDPILNF